MAPGLDQPTLGTVKAISFNCHGLMVTAGEWMNPVTSLPGSQALDLFGREWGG